MSTIAINRELFAKDLLVVYRKCPMPAATNTDEGELPLLIVAAKLLLDPFADNSRDRNATPPRLALQGCGKILRQANCYAYHTCIIAYSDAFGLPWVPTMFYCSTVQSFPEVPMNFEQIIYDKQDGIATITLNRPERMNAFTAKMIDEWYAALWDAHTDPDVRVVIVTGAGSRGFCTGADVGGGGPLGGLQNRQRTAVENRNFLRDGVQRIPRLVSLMEKPYIAAINGAAVGAGMDMASMCDIRFAAESARFGMTYVRMGIIPGDGGAYYLPRIIGTARALDLIWTGRLIDAREALAMGYVSAVVPDDVLINFTREYALKLAKGPAVAIQLAKRLVYRSAHADADAALDLAQQAMYIAQGTEDAVEGPRAFAEKREPDFKGR